MSNGLCGYLNKLAEEKLINVLELFKAHGNGSLFIVKDIVDNVDDFACFSIEFERLLWVCEHYPHVFSFFCRCKQFMLFDAILLSTRLKNLIESSTDSAGLKNDQVFGLIALLIKLKKQYNVTLTQNTLSQPSEAEDECSVFQQALQAKIPASGLLGESQEEVAEYLWQLMSNRSPLLSFYLGRDTDLGVLDLNGFFSAISGDVNAETLGEWLIGLLQYPRLLKAFYQIFSYSQNDLSYIKKILVQNSPEQLNRWLVEPTTVEEALVGFGFLPYGEILSSHYGATEVSVNAALGNHFLTVFKNSGNQERASQAMVGALRFLGISLEIEGSVEQDNDDYVVSEIQKKLCDTFSDSENGHGGMVAANVLDRIVGSSLTSRTERMEYQQAVHQDTRDFLKERFKEMGMDLDELGDDVLEYYKNDFGSDPQYANLLQAVNKELERRSTLGASGGGTAQLDFLNRNQVYIQGRLIENIDDYFLNILLNQALEDGNEKTVGDITQELIRRKTGASSVKKDLKQLETTELGSLFEELMNSGQDVTAVIAEMERRNANNSKEGASTSGSRR